MKSAMNKPYEENARGTAIKFAAEIIRKYNLSDEEIRTLDGTKMTELGLDFPERIWLAYYLTTLKRD